MTLVVLHTLLIVLLPCLSRVWSVMGNCEPVRVSQCMLFHYNSTLYPNLLRHRTQVEAASEFNQFVPLIKMGCARQLLLFLCTTYVPMCTIMDYPIPPCRHVCEQSRDGCLSVLQRFGLSWPDHLACERFPAFSTSKNSEICVSENTTDSRNDVSSTKPKPTPAKICPTKFKVAEDMKNTFLGFNACASPCYGVFFNSRERAFTLSWILFWSVLCLVSSQFTLGTFLIDRRRFRYPERPVIFLSACYSVVSVVYLVGYFYGQSIACHSFRSSLIQVHGTRHAPCTVSFMFSYFFTIAAGVWWLMLALTWFLAACLKWSHEAIESLSQCFHSLAWILPAGLTIAVLATNEVEGDALVGVCSVGIHNTRSLSVFVIVPLLVIVSLGSLLLLCGYGSLLRVRRALRREKSADTEKLTKFMLRVGVFSILYGLPTVTVLACLFYQLSWASTWDRSYLEAWWRECRDNESACLDRGIQSKSRPDYAIMLIRYLMLFMPGITSGFWMWSKKTVFIWKKFFSRLTPSSRLHSDSLSQPLKLVHTGDRSAMF